MWLGVLLVCVLPLRSDSNPKPKANANPRIFTDDPFVDENKFVEVVFRHEIVTVVGEKTELPCDMAENLPNERPKLVLWYKGKNRLPLYSLDLRDPGLGQHWRDNKTLGDRGVVNYEESLNSMSKELLWTSALEINPVREADGGIYRCRIDFSNLPTYNAWIKIKIVVPPSLPVLQNDEGRVLSDESDPLVEGDPYTVHCRTHGDPTPTISWSLGGRPIQPMASTMDSSGDLRSTVLLRKLYRKDNGQVLTCTASNNDRTSPISTHVTLRVLSPPKSVSIDKRLGSFQAGQKYNVSCTVTGSFPIPRVQVYRGSTLLPVLLEYSKTDMEHTVVASLEVSRIDQGEFLTCRAVNPEIPEYSIEDQRNIQVLYGPLVSVEVLLGNPVLKETGNITFKCNVKSNPPADIIHWFRKDRDLETLMEENMKIRGDILSIRNITRKQSGEYYCKADNSVKHSLSESITVQVHYVPVCVRDRTIISARRGESIQLDCDMRSTEESAMFAWSSGDQVPLPDQYTFTSQRVEDGEKLEFISSSQLEYRVPGDTKQSRVQCSANNTMGMSYQPCEFIINLKDAGVPELKSCGSFDHTYTSFTIHCQVSTQFQTSQLTFNYEVFESTTSEFYKKVSTTSPNITFIGLPSSKDYVVDVYVSGGDEIGTQGRLAPYKIEAFTLRTNEKQMAASTEKEPDSAMGFVTIIGILAGILVMVVFIVSSIFIIRRRAGSGGDRTGKTCRSDSSSVMLKNSSSSVYNANEEEATMMELGDDATTPTPSNSKCATPEFKPEKPYELKYIELCGQGGNENVVFQNQMMLYPTNTPTKSTSSSSKGKGGEHHLHLDEKMVQELYTKAISNQNVYSTLPRTQHLSQRTPTTGHSQCSNHHASPSLASGSGSGAATQHSLGFDSSSLSRVTCQSASHASASHTPAQSHSSSLKSIKRVKFKDEADKSKECPLCEQKASGSSSSGSSRHNTLDSHQLKQRSCFGKSSSSCSAPRRLSLHNPEVKKKSCLSPSAGHGSCHQPLILSPNPPSLHSPGIKPTICLPSSSSAALGSLQHPLVGVATLLPPPPPPPSMVGDDMDYMKSGLPEDRQPMLPGHGDMVGNIDVATGVIPPPVNPAVPGNQEHQELVTSFICVANKELESQI